MKFRALFVSACIIPVIAFSAYNGWQSDKSPQDSTKWSNMVNVKNAPDVIRRLVDSMYEELEKDSNRFPELIKDMEDYASQIEDPEVEAIFHSLIAEMYSGYYHNNFWTISQRSPLADFLPEDIREWSPNLFKDKIAKEVKASLEPSDVLQKTNADKYKTILDLKTDSRELRPTLYDFLLQRAIQLDADSAEAYYQKWMAFRQTQPNKKAQLLVALDYIKEFVWHSRKSQNEAYMQALDSLSLQYTDKECRLELALARLQMLTMFSQTNYTESENDKEKKATKDLYEYTKQCVQEFGKNGRAAEFYRVLSEMELPFIIVRHDNNIYPGKSLSLKLTYRNVQKIKVTIYKNEEAPEAAMRQNRPKRSGLVKTSYFELLATEPFLAQDTLLEIPMEKNGLYCYKVEEVGKKVSFSGTFSVSRLAAIVRPATDGKSEVLVTDFESGKPLSGVTVICYGNSYYDHPPRKGKVVTDKQGFALIDLPQAKTVRMIRPVMEGDTASLPTYVYGNNFRQERKAVEKASLFTDRSIYRPGQTVFFKGILYTDDKQTLAKAGEEYVVSLRDANQKEVARKNFKTNEFGSFNGEFILPEGSLSGRFSLSSAHASVSFRVEEYKRPTFVVSVDSVEETVSFGETLWLKGKAVTYSGVPLSSGKVSWNISTVPYRFARYYMPASYISENEEISSGSAELNEDGTFKISFVPERLDMDKKSVVQEYEVSISLTDSKGETQEVKNSFIVGDTRILFAVDLPSQMIKEEAQWVVSALTLNGKRVKATGEYALYTLKSAGKDRWNNQERWEKAEQVAFGSFVSDQVMGKELLASLPSNRYRLVIIGKDDRGKVTETERDFVLYSMNDKRPPVETDSWMPLHDLSLSPGETGNVLFGTSRKSVFLYYELFTQKGKLLKRELVKMDNENLTFPVKFEENYGDAVTASFTYIRDGKLISDLCRISRKTPDKKLAIMPETFRDYLIPGNLETWKFRLLMPDSSAAKAEVLASMYDASLDAIATHQWNFAPKHQYLYWFQKFQSGLAFDTSYQSGEASREYKATYVYQYDELYRKWYDVLEWASPYAQKQVLYKHGMLRSKGAVAPLAMNATAMDGVEDMSLSEAVVEEAEVSMDTQSDFDKSEDSFSLYLRKDLKETAFFYPVLRTNDQGEISFDFTLPESNTTWKLQLLAHTDSMEYGYLSKEIISSKPVMVQPNLPRFLREGDQVALSVQILNQSGKDLDGKVSLEFFVPEDNRIIYRAEKSFTATSDGQTGIVQWNMPVADWSCYGVVGCRIMASSAEGNDGEQHLLPVFSNQVMITESIPFYLMDENEKDIRLPRQALENPYRVTFELASNPIWYAVQALSTLDVTDHEDLVSLLAVYFSNTLSQYIAHSNPKLQQVIQKWRAEGRDSQTLLSNLEKNSELKSILVEETPWVMEAENETEQKQRLQLLFDMNRAANQKKEVMNKLQERQLPDGGWGWMPGMQSNRYMTIQVLDAMAHLIELNAAEYSETEKLMQLKALGYLDRSIQEEYEWDKKHNLLETVPSENKVYTLWVRSCYRDIPETDNSHEAYHHYTTKATANWKEYDLATRAIIGKLSKRNGNQKLAEAILDWFKKTATVDKEKGMYWANNRSLAVGLQTGLETHCLIMSLYSDMNQEREQMNLMKQWLLGQKRTQNWESTAASIDAIYALLLTGDSWINSSNHCQILWAGESWSSDRGETATGYLKVSPSNDKLKQNKDHVVRIEKQGNAPAWGAIYTQYFSPIHSVEKNKGVLNVEKKLFKERYESGKRRLIQITEEQPLCVGDKVIVRLTLRSDRVMNYVYLKDLRSACMEPVSQLSQTEYRDGIWYYHTSRDLSENFYIENMPEGTFVLEYPAYISRDGKYSGGLSSIQCLYAPEYVSHTEGTILEVKK